MQRAALDRAQGALSVLAASGQTTDEGAQPTPLQQAAARAQAKAGALASKLAELVNAEADPVALCAPLQELELWRDVAWALTVSNSSSGASHQ